MLEEKLKDIVNTYFELSDRNDCFLVELVINPSKKVDVFLDSDKGVDFEVCTSISRKIEEYLDSSLSLGEDYTLNVSSHGLDRYLMMPRQFVKNIGREVTVKSTDKSKQIGTLTTADENGFTISYPVKVKVGNKKQVITEEKSFDYSDNKVFINIKF